MPRKIINAIFEAIRLLKINLIRKLCPISARSSAQPPNYYLFIRIFFFALFIFLF